MDRKDCYLKGNMMTFPLELREMEKSEKMFDNKYLYPPEIKNIQMEIDEICDKMEYDGSMMYDECPDKVTVEKVAQAICRKDSFKKYCDKDDKKWFFALVQVMLCNEMAYRRNRRVCHKDRMVSK